MLWNTVQADLEEPEQVWAACRTIQMPVECQHLHTKMPVLEGRVSVYTTVYITVYHWNIDVWKWAPGFVWLTWTLWERDVCLSVCLSQCHQVSLLSTKCQAINQRKATTPHSSRLHTLNITKFTYHYVKQSPLLYPRLLESKNTCEEEVRKSWSLT